MTDLVKCLRLHKDAEKMPAPPFPGKLGLFIFENICAESFNEWLELQTKIINENKLDLSNPESQEFLYQEMTQFLHLG